MLEHIFISLRNTTIKHRYCYHVRPLFCLTFILSLCTNYPQYPTSDMRALPKEHFCYSWGVCGGRLPCYRWYFSSSTALLLLLRGSRGQTHCTGESNGLTALTGSFWEHPHKRNPPLSNNPQQRIQSALALCSWVTSVPEKYRIYSRNAARC